jgi:uncharacterized protein YgfB (UPF0149 family)
MDIQTPLEFDAVEELLSAADAQWYAAEAHGAFCGWACLSGSGAISGWSEELLANGTRAHHDVLQGERQRQLLEMAAAALLQLERGDMAFAPLLPGEDAALSDRTASLAEWCQGFMHGLAAGGAESPVPAANALGAELVREILDDFSAITRAEVGEDTEEISEQAYAELVEYVRVSAQLVYDETMALRDRSGKEQ